MEFQTRTNSRSEAADAVEAIRIGYLLLSDEPSKGDREAMAWLEDDSAEVLRVPVNRVGQALADVEALWIHVADEQAWTRWSPAPAVLGILLNYVERGGRLLLTNYAALLPHAMGIEPCKPEARTAEIQDKGFGREYGFQSYRGHPVLKPFFGGIHLWYPDRDCTVSRVGYFDDAWPAAGRVVGIERSYITLHQDNKLLIDHTAGDGRILSAGGFIHFGEKNHRADEARRFIRHALQYLVCTPEDGSATYWTADDHTPVRIDVETEPLGRTTPYERLPQRHGHLRLSRNVATDNFVDVVGRRCMVMGREHGGIDEVWVHPFRLFHGMEVGIVQDGAPEDGRREDGRREGDRVQWLAEIAARVDIYPESVVRTYTLASGTLRETMWAAHDEPGGVVAFEAEDTRPLRLVIRLRTDFRWMWPYRENALGSLRYGYDDELNAVHVRDRSGDFRAIFGGDRAPAARLVGPYERIDFRDGAFDGAVSARNEIALAYLFDLGDEDRLHFAFSGTNDDPDEAERTFRRLLSDPAASYDDVSRHYERLLNSCTVLTTPDPDFNIGYLWALIGTDRFWATTPGIGTGLVAGYGTTSRGWPGGHEISGRPGYAWYFGRDAQWASFAVNGYGDFPLVREQLDLFRRFQGFDGKIFHEMPTSGPVHYDAADSTPLYVILAAHYLRVSGDVYGLRTLWPSLQMAMEFLYRTDTDGDGLIENTHVGHGWIEGGKLYGAHTTLYLAGTWAKALRDAAYIARAVGEDDAAERYAADAEAVVNRIETDFWNPESGFYDYGKLRDGSFNPEQTILPAVLAYFRLLRPDRLCAMLRAFASSDFTTDWGIRILSTRSSLYNPQGYHYGSVWPLFGGWVALAEYTSGRSVQGFTHVMNNLLQYRHWSLGLMEEVLNGVTYEPAGVCAHQCWSHTNVLHPLFEGMVGCFPDAPHRRLRLEPRIPAAWNTFRAENLRIGASLVALVMERSPGRTIFRLILQEGPPVTVTFAPEIPNGMRLLDVQIDGASSKPHARGRTGLLEQPLEISLEENTVVTLHHDGGLEVLPIVPRPEPGDASVHPRILDAALDRDVYRIELEGRAGSESDLRVRLFDQPIGRVEGAEVLDGSYREVLRLRTSFEGEAGERSTRTINIHLARKDRT